MLRNLLTFHDRLCFVWKFVPKPQQIYLSFSQAAIVRHYRKLSASSLLGREYFMVPEGMIPAHNVPQLFTFPGGMPGNGLSGRFPFSFFEVGFDWWVTSFSL